MLFKPKISVHVKRSNTCTNIFMQLVCIYIYIYIIYMTYILGCCHGNVVTKGSQWGGVHACVAIIL